MNRELRGLVLKADHAFRAYMRHQWGTDENILCCTCQHTFAPCFIDVGHIVGRSFYATRWLEENVEPQCVFCNRNDAGAGIEAKVEAVDPQRVRQLKKIAYDPTFRVTADFIIKAIERYEKAAG